MRFASFLTSILLGGCLGLSAAENQIFEVANVGSTTALHAFAWGAAGLAGTNLAARSQGSAGNFAALRKHADKLRPGATIILALAPMAAILPTDFGSASTATATDEDALRTRQATLDEERQAGANFAAACQVLFKIADFSAPLTPTNAIRRMENLVRYREMIDWCHACGYRPVLVLPPLSEGFDSLLTTSFRENYLDGFVRDLARTNVQWLDFSTDKYYRRNGCFADGFVLNQTGAANFTRNLVQRLKSLDGLYTLPVVGEGKNPTQADLDRLAKEVEL